MFMKIQFSLFVARIREQLRDRFVRPFASLRLRTSLSLVPDIQREFATGRKQKTSTVERYWSGHTIAPFPFFSEQKSKEYFDTLDKLYPLYFAKAGLFESKKNEIVLDFGCGPGNDLLGWLLYSDAQRVIGIDISEKALEIARRRLALHVKEFEPERVDLRLIAEDSTNVPLPSESVDYISCLGVLHHVSNPTKVLDEFLRILKPGGEARIMLYNYDSLYVHLSVAYELQVLQGFCSGESVEMAFERLSDGGAPISRLTRASDFLSQTEEIGFQSTYLGAAFSITELEAWGRVGKVAASDSRLNQSSREFLEKCSPDSRGFPMIDGHEAGLDSIYSLVKSK